MKQIADTEPCLCHSGKSYVNCCKPVITDHSEAKTAEQLMRARYVSFVLQETEFILKTWDEKKRPKALNFEDNPVSWLGLEVHSSSAGQTTDDAGEVEFTASYIENGALCRLKERSLFRKKDGLWYYLYGQCHVTTEKNARNAPCPCGSGKKFKKCCYSLR